MILSAFKIIDLDKIIRDEYKGELTSVDDPEFHLFVYKNLTDKITLGRVSYNDIKKMLNSLEIDKCKTVNDKIEKIFETEIRRKNNKNSNIYLAEYLGEYYLIYQENEKIIFYKEKPEYCGIDRENYKDLQIDPIEDVESLSAKNYLNFLIDKFDEYEFNGDWHPEDVHLIFDEIQMWGVDVSDSFRYNGAIILQRKLRNSNAK